MFVGRKEELKKLDEVYASEHSNLIILYGREGIGKTALVKHFAQNRKSVRYYRATEVIDKLQVRPLSVSEIVQELSSAAEKRLIIIDEFHYVDPAVMRELVESLYGDEQLEGRFMLILISSSINWVENSMVSEQRSVAKHITGLIKLKEFDFSEMVEWFPKSSVEDTITIKALCGGIPRYLSLWQENRRVKENIISLFFSPDSPFLHEPERILKLELRELSAYNTILTALASGRYKLNDIYSFTGFSRAKISVYLKNLIEMDIVEKIFSVNVRKSENTQKGLYRIKDNFLNFYYAYVFPNLSEIEFGNGRNVFLHIPETEFESYMRYYYADVCREYLSIMSRYRKLKYRYSEWRSWFGKSGTLDIVGNDDQSHILVGMCSYSPKELDEDALEELKKLYADAGLRPDSLCLFARAGFSEELRARCRKEGIITVALSDL